MKHRIAIVRTVTIWMQLKKNVPYAHRISLGARTVVRMGPRVKSAMIRENSFWIIRQRSVCARKDFSWKRGYAHYAHQKTSDAPNAHSKEPNARNVIPTPISFLIQLQNYAPASQLTTLHPTLNANCAVKPSHIASAAKAILLSSKALPLNVSSVKTPLNLIRQNHHATVQEKTRKLWKESASIRKAVVGCFTQQSAVALCCWSVLECLHT